MITHTMINAGLKTGWPESMVFSTGSGRRAVSWRATVIRAGVERLDELVGFWKLLHRHQSSVATAVPGLDVLSEAGSAGIVGKMYRGGLSGPPRLPSLQKKRDGLAATWSGSTTSRTSCGRPAEASGPSAPPQCADCWWRPSRDGRVRELSPCGVGRVDRRIRSVGTTCCHAGDGRDPFVP